MWQRMRDLMDSVKETVGADALPVPEVPAVDEAVARGSDQAFAAAGSVTETAASAASDQVAGAATSLTETAAGAASDAAAAATDPVGAVAEGAANLVDEATGRLSGLLDRLGG